MGLHGEGDRQEEGHRHGGGQAWDGAEHNAHRDTDDQQQNGHGVHHPGKCVSNQG